ncbi:MAG: hypothetical protein RML40_01095 [Bacteroidota bacterium]|nr:hypothetical protein [Bacteroidota bacterium]
MRLRTLTSSSLGSHPMKGTIRGGSFLSSQRVRSYFLRIISLASCISPTVILAS